jgi:Protein of unknown function (DUF2891)
MLNDGQAEALAQGIARSISTAYPNHVQHLYVDAQDRASPQLTHPAFSGSYDWHSCVHMHWSLVRLLNQFNANAVAPQVLNANLRPEKITAELRYFQHPARRSFSRPYGWAWLLKLDSELRLCNHADALQWRAALAPLVAHLACAFEAHLPQLTTPIRHGVHTNTAFACIHALQWAKLNNRQSLIDLIEQRARHWFGDDVAHGVFWEPSGADFLSPTLTEALLMSQVLSMVEFRTWFAAYLPVPLTETPLGQNLEISDRSDPHIVHLDGLNLSRAWCARGLLCVLEFGTDQSKALFAMAQRALNDSAPQVLGGDFVATHWLASFLLLAETEFTDVL